MFDAFASIHSDDRIKEGSHVLVNPNYTPHRDQLDPITHARFAHYLQCCER